MVTLNSKELFKAHSARRNLQLDVPFEVSMKILNSKWKPSPPSITSSLKPPVERQKMQGTVLRIRKSASCFSLYVR